MPPVLALTVARPAIPGHDLVATLTTSEALADVAAALVRTELYRKKGEREMSNASYNSSSTEDAIDLLVYAAPVASTDETEVEVFETVELGAVEGTREFRIPVPGDAEPSSPDLISWALRVSRDAKAEAEVIVTTTPANADPEKHNGRGDDDEWISLRVPGGVVAAARGQRLTGTVVLEPTQGAKLTDVRIVLIRMLNDRVSSRGEERLTEVQITGALDLEPGMRQELPFAIDVPADAPPTCVTAHNACYYWLLVTAARRMRKDFKNHIRLYVAAAE